MQLGRVNLLRLVGVALGAGAAALSQAALAGDEYWISYSGIPGAITTPTARMQPEGTVGFGISSALPYNRLYLNAQPFSWLNFNARYTDITDRPYSSSNNGQSYKDKGFDVAVQLWPGGGILPAVSVGLVDLGGTGLFSGEYISVTQRILDFYATVGLGWGRLGAAGDFRNPLTLISESLEERELELDDISDTGNLSYKTWFRGPDVGIFGSLVWNPSDYPVAVIAEWDGNDYSDEPAGRAIDSASRLNVGFRYEFLDSAFAALSYQRGNTVAFQLGVMPQVGSDTLPKFKPYLPDLDRDRAAAYRRVKVGADAERFRKLYDALRTEGFFVHAMDLDDTGSVFTVWQSNAVSADLPYVLSFVGGEASNYLPESVETLRVVSMAGGAEAMTSVVPRSLVDDLVSGRAAPEELVYRASYEAGGVDVDPDRALYPNLLRYPTYAYGASPALRSNIGGPVDFYVAQLLLKPFATVQFTPRWSATGTVGISVLSDLDRLVTVRSGTLPPVRSDLEKYQSGSGDVYLEQLETNYIFPIAKQWFGRVSAGIFEEMYGGVAAEVLYKPFASRWAVSVDANYVKQRGFKQQFEFRDYEVATGHVTLYYDSPWKGVSVALSGGRYLAKDVGATLNISRGFRNGARFGVFATKTDVSSKEFGEGSFDKGFFIYIPLSVFSKQLQQGGTSFEYRFLARDGGQKVRDGRSLYGVFGQYDAGAVYGR